MEKQRSKPKLITGIALALAAFGLIMSLMLVNSNGGLKKNLDTEKLKAERLLAEKLQLDKEVSKYNEEVNQFKRELDDLKGRNTELDKLLIESQRSLTDKQAQVNRLSKSNASKKTIEKELAELKKMKAGFDEKTSSLNQQIGKLNNDNRSLEEENNSLKQKLEALGAQNKELVTDNSILKSMVADDYLISGFKGRKDKLTLIARKTDKLTLSFDVPEDIAASLKFNVIDPQGQKVNSDESKITSRILDTDQKNNSLPASAVKDLKMKRIEMEYNPKEKFTKGSYKIEIFNNSNYLGSCQVRLK